jgi:bifunctional oligoribonuclease and PAP phosphatase NrnA
MKSSRATLFIEEHDKFIITAHETPDGDALGSECALYSALKVLGKEVLIFNADPTPYKYQFIAEKRNIEQITSEEQLPDGIDEYVLIILDTNDIENIGTVKDIVLTRVKDYFIIDHHENDDEFETNHLIQVDASSTCEILFSLFEELQIDLTFDLAQPLYVGIVYDTGSFIYPKTTARTFSIAEKLVRTGVNPNSVYSHLYESNSISALVLQSKVLASLELLYNSHVAVQTMLKETVQECGASYEEADTLINIPLKSEKILVSVFFKENLEGILRCSLRSKGDINVAEIAQRFSGGGHKTAAGFKCREPLETTKKEVLQQLQKYFR